MRSTACRTHSSKSCLFVALGGVDIEQDTENRLVYGSGNIRQTEEQKGQ